MSVVYQPKIDLRTGKPVSVEALVRWPHHERGLLAPDSFLPLVRQHGLMRGVTELVLSRALDDVVTWKAKGVREPVSVNLTAPSVADTNLPVYIAASWPPGVWSRPCSPSRSPRIAAGEHRAGAQCARSLARQRNSHRS